MLYDGFDPATERTCRAHERDAAAAGAALAARRAGATGYLRHAAICRTDIDAGRPDAPRRDYLCTLQPVLPPIRISHVLPIWRTAFLPARDCERRPEALRRIRRRLA